jgi:hypothetical protein
MDDSSCRSFFLHPADTPQRLYEALRAVFLDGCRQKDIAQRFGLRFDAFRQHVRQFRAACAAGQPPPFWLPARGDDRRRHRHRRGSQSTLPSPTAARGG